MPLETHQRVIAAFPRLERSGRLDKVVGLTLRATGPAVAVGECCRIESSRGSRVAMAIGFDAGGMLLQPLGSTDGIRPGDRVVALDGGLEIPVGPTLIGRVIDALGRPMDGLGPIDAPRALLHRDPPAPLTRRPITQILETRIKVIDTMFTLGRGQRIGIFAGSGVGKSVLLGELAKFARADVNVIALVGERGREVGEFLHKVLGPEGLARSVVIASTSDRPAVERLAAAYAAHSIAEAFRDQGRDVLLMMDSLTRFCQAQREIGLAAGEPPSVRGFPPSAFALLPRLLERSGTDQHGSITGIYTVLVEGDDESEPVADNSRAILDGHLFLSRRLAGQAIYPAIDPMLSISRLQVDLLPTKDYQLSTQTRELWGEYERIRDLVEIGAYQQGSNPIADRAIRINPKLREFIRQNMGQSFSHEESTKQLAAILGEGA